MKDEREVRNLLCFALEVLSIQHELISDLEVGLTAMESLLQKERPELWAEYQQLRERTERETYSERHTRAAHVDRAVDTARRISSEPS